MRRSLSLVGVLLFSLCGCRKPAVPESGSKPYQELVRAFYLGLAGLQSGEDVRAQDGLTRATQIAPGEAAAWANLATLSTRQQNLDVAFTQADTARRLAPQNSRIEQLLGDIESRRGNLPQAIQHLQHAVQLDAGNLKALYMLAEQSERQSPETGAAEALKWFQTALKESPKNAALLLEVARASAKTNNRPILHGVVETLNTESAAWPDVARQQMQKLAEAASSADLHDAAIQVAYVRNILLRVPEYRLALAAVKTPAVFVGDPFLTFLNATPASAEAAEPDLKTAFTAQPLASAPESGVQWMRADWLDGSGKPSILWADDAAVHILDGATIPFRNPRAVALADLNYDFKNDLVIAGDGGLAIYQQDTPQKFTDVTAQSHVPPEILHGAYSGAWPFDVDLDGDLDIVLAVNGSAPVVLRNNGDGTFGIVRLFEGVTGGISFAAADLDGDGTPDVAIVGSDGKLSVFTNERFGRFQRRTLPDNLASGVVAVASGDVNRDGAADFVVLKSDGSILRLSDKDDARLAQAAPQTLGSASISLADFDNNGALDLLTGDGEVFLNNGHGFAKLSGVPPIASATAVDWNGDGRLDIAGLSARKPALLVNRGAKNYHWQTIRLRAANAHGDQRINSFGLGGEIEIRAGLLAEKQIVSAPVLHFGLGEHLGTDLARIVWPNGSVQAEFELKADESILSTQRLKGSCPSLFAWDGKQMRFVKDAAPWSPALGLHINAQKVAGITQTEEWFKIPGSEIVPRDGYYDLRVTAELWETFYIDHYSLLAVDHPKDTDIYSDERFSVPPPKLSVYVTSNAKPFARAMDDNGRDVGAIVRDEDGKYLDTFGRGQYQGVTRDHWVELELPEDAPREGSLYLIAEGWTHPTDATVNIAMGQSGNPPPQSLSIEVPDANGHWITAKSGLGFLAGKLKTAVLDLTGVFRPGAPRKLRLATNMEIYWDRLAWATGEPDNRMQTQKIDLASADLRHRGFSLMSQADASSPEIPIYSQLESTSQKWRDLEGYYTRFGDVRELLQKVDNRIVIMDAGDELRLRFSAPAPPPDGWVRDLVMIGDGWIKDGDYNSVFSRTVLPLPYHGIKDYSVPPGRLEDDPAYKMHPQDWRLFHTRYVTAEPFRTELWSQLWNVR